MIDILIPSLGRADKLAPLMQNIAATTPPTYAVIFVLDEDDAESREALRGYVEPGYVVLQGGSYPRKTNAGYEFGSSPLVLPTADDVVFYPGWLEAALEAFEDPAIQVVGTRDLSPITADGSHVTMPIIRRSYVEDPGAVWEECGKIFHEGYHHGWVETELWQLAQHRGVAKFAPESIIEHLHPDWGTREPDATDLKGNAGNKSLDQALFNSRRAQWAR